MGRHESGKSAERTILKYATIICVITWIYILVGVIVNRTINEGDLGSEYKYWSDSKMITGPFTTLDVIYNVDNYNYNDKYIIVKQFVDPKYEERANTINKDCSQKGMNIYDYWIIDKEENCYYGPMGYEKYQNTKDSLKISLEFADK